MIPYYHHRHRHHDSLTHAISVPDGVQPCGTGSVPRDARPPQTPKSTDGPTGHVSETAREGVGTDCAVPPPARPEDLLDALHPRAEVDSCGGVKETETGEYTCLRSTAVEG